MALAIGAMTFALSSPAEAQQQARWDVIQKRGSIIQGCIAQPPYWSQTSANGDWKGWGIVAGKKLAEDMKVKMECGETAWGTAALMIQSGKIDLLWAMQATPLRATTITFAGPLYNHGFMTINNKAFNGKNWSDYDKPNVRIAVETGTSMALVRKVVAPTANTMELQGNSDVTLAVVAGRADAAIYTVMNGIVAKDRNPELGSFVIPQPLFSFPAYVGVPNENDRRYSDFLHWWTEWYRLQGNVEKWIRAAMIESGVKPESIPDKLYF
ncbi:MAG: transporter substrate-binding domain-containing protein [Proteobacteria bacterium]|nr:transporter substrate-binding domain-containing protein [Pseudomonadota bacterium]